MKTITILFIVLITAYSFPQENVLFEQQKKANTNNLREIQKIKSPISNHSQQILHPIKLSSTLGLWDTLQYPMPSPGTNFGLFGQDWVLQWFKAPAELLIIGFGVYCTDNPNDTPAEAKIVRLNWSEAQLLAQQDKLHGYYPADGSIAGITSFLDNPDRTGNWVAIDTTETEPFEHDIWSDNGIGYTFIPDETLKDYQWIDTDVLGYEPTIKEGEVFGVAVKNTSTVLDSNRIGFFAGEAVVYPFWKFYANGRLIPGVDKGWWTRELTFDFQVAVDIMSGGEGPIISSFTYLPSTLSTEARPIEATAFWGGWPKKSEHNILVSAFYSTNGGSNWTETRLNHILDDLYTGEIPGFPPNTTVVYYLEAKDSLSSSLMYMTYTCTYTIFGPSGANTLLVFNGYTNTTGYPQNYYFGSGEWPANYNTLIFPHDVWAYDSLTAELLSYYTNVLEICTNGPNDINSDAIRAWLEESGTHNYMLAGDEWLGAQSHWTDGPHSAGDFIFDILGINYEYNDINYTTSGDELLPSIVYPQPGSALGGPIFDLYNYVSFDSSWTAPMTYDPFYRIGIDNWLDGVDFEPDVEVDMKGLAIDGTTVYNIGGHRTLPAGNKIAFFAYDPLSLNSDTENEVEYFWYGFMNTAPHAEPLLDWFGIPVEVEKEDDLLPKAYILSQNYPNPFNPSTIIKYALGGRQLVTLKVFDLLGREVATLVNEEKPAGNYEVEFKSPVGSLQLASGIYFYRLQAGSYIETKKMIYLK